MQIKPLEVSNAITVNGQTIFLSEADIDRAFWETADLYDTDHCGPAAVTVGAQTLVLAERDWNALYAATEAHIQNDLDLIDTGEVSIH